ncbi:RraA family protein [Nocardioides albus]|uniref:Putative 4-hydroxy-4-methyl-2-oxoglutarate aldolase n=1 Tax=Nocardioides albus TaxID=1841 RepID=A0A7W5A420_9ACTN|nr:RraA family protein [Nocardioides albus]MBB3089296.1 regulator of RNase E activity RraA [Nocardioides albus]GGU12930.1 diguanylate cyclase [Nocardioides albus]
MTASSDPQIIDRFRKIASASVADAVEQHGHRGYLAGRVGQIRPGKIVGPAVTVLEEPSDTVEPPTHALDAIDASPAGSVLCIAAGGADVAVFGGLMAAGAVVNELAGVVLDAAVRDVEEITRDYPDFPVYAAGKVSATTVGRYRSVSSNQPVLLGDVEVHPGDLIVADTDGVVRVPAALVEQVLVTAEEIERRESEQTRLILEARSLKTGLELYNRV